MQFASGGVDGKRVAYFSSFESLRNEVVADAGVDVDAAAAATADA